MKAVLCPVCYGEGTVPDKQASTAAAPDKTCNGCGGKGWVAVPEDIYPTVKVPLREYWWILT